MEQLDVFLKLIDAHKFLSALVILSVSILVASLLRGVNLVLKIVYIFLIFGFIGLGIFTLITLFY